MKNVSASRRCNGREATARLSNQHASRVCSPDKAERSPFPGDELSAGSLGSGNDFVEALVTAQRIPAGIEAEIAV
jgi:hypothetical protein